MRATLTKALQNNRTQNMISTTSPLRRPHRLLSPLGEDAAVMRGIALLYLFILTTMATFRGRHANELLSGGGFDAQVKFQAASWVLLGLVAGYLLLRGFVDRRLWHLGPLMWFAGFASLALLSAGWSLVPTLTTYRAGQLIIGLLLVAALGRRVHYLYWLVCFYMALNWLCVTLSVTGLHFNLEWLRGPQDAYIPGASSSPWRFATAFGHPSQISIIAAGAAVGWAARMPDKPRAGHVAILGWLALTVFLTFSRKSLAGMLVGLTLVAILRRRIGLLILAMMTLVPLSILFVPQVKDLAQQTLFRGQSAREFSSLTGRDIIYAEAIKRIQENWALGYGYRAGRAAILREEGGFFGVTHSHNLFLEAAASLGIGGALLALAVLGAYAIVAMRLMALLPPVTRAGPLSPGWEHLIVLITIVPYSLLGVGFAAEFGPFTLFFVASCADLMWYWVDRPRKVRTVDNRVLESPPVSSSLSEPPVRPLWNPSRPFA